MPIFGYSKRTVGEHGLLEMSEVTFQVSPADLRLIARFLIECADLAESNEWRTSHRHLTESEPAWEVNQPASDIIVIHPDPTPPKRVL